MERPADWTSDDWSTPPEIVQEYAAEFGGFDVDPCCTPSTAKAPFFYTKADDGLKQPWAGRVWINPPYSDPTPWVQRAYEATKQGECDLVVMLLPAATDTGWFHDWVLEKAELRFRRGRIRFHGWQGTPIGSPKTPSIIAIYRHA